MSSYLSKLMSDISSAFQLSLNGKEAELASMLQSRMIDAAACQTTGMYSGWSLLHAAASKGHMRIVQMFMAAGAPASAFNPKSKTPAQVAHEKGHSEVAALLQQAEASPGAAKSAAATAMERTPPPPPPPLQHRKPAWFRDLFGFDESSTWGDNVNHFHMDGDTLVCRTAPQFPRQFVGRFECPSVAELRSKLAAAQGAVCLLYTSPSPRDS